MIRNEYWRWEVSRRLRKAFAVVFLGPPLLILSPFLLIGDALARGFNTLFNAR